MMITAAEAKKLYDESGKEIQDYISANIEKQVINSAKSGKRSITVNIGSLNSFQYVNDYLTPLNKGVFTELKKLGYNVKVDKYGDKYVPRGLADENGNGPVHQNYGFIIGW